MSITLAYHFVGDTLHDGSPVPPDGKWLTVEPPIKMCRRGLHWSEHPWDALQYAPGAVLCRVEYGGEIERGVDKGVSTQRRILARFDATDMLYEHARQSALSVIHLWNAPDVVREYLTTGREDLRAAAQAAAQAAARAAARKRFADAVDAKFKEMGL